MKFEIFLRSELSLSLLGCTSLMAMAANASAQSVDAGNAVTSSGVQSGGLEEIIVTARKKEENIQNIPVAANVVTGETLSTFKIATVEAVSSLAPQLIVGRAAAGNGASIGMRGVSVPNTSVSLEQSVATIVDGVYISGGHAINEGLFDIGRIEVLKGPQSLFYGKNTTAGAISISTADPTRTFEGSIRGGYEFNASAPSVEAYLSGPLSDTLSARIAAKWSRQFGSLFTNYSVPHIDSSFDSATGVTTPRQVAAEAGDAPGERSFLTRATLLFEPDSNFSARLKFTYNNNHTLSPAATLVTYYCPNGGRAQNDPTMSCGKNFLISQNPMATAEAATNRLFNKHGGSTYHDYKSYNLSGDFTYRGDTFTLSVTPGYVQWQNGFMGDFDYTPNFASPAGKGNHSAEETTLKAFSVETRLETSFDGPLNFLVGGYFQDQKLKFDQEVVFPNGPSNSAAADPSAEFVTVRKDSFSNGKTYAGFAQLRYDITDRLNFTTGARYTHEKKNSRFEQPYVTPLFTAVFEPRAIGMAQKFNNFSPEATLTFKPTPQLTTYVSYKTGYKSGGFDISGLIVPTTLSANASYKPEKVKGFEGGVKSTLLDNQLRMNVDMFWFTYDNLQINFLDAASLRYFTLNAAKMRTRGGEMQVEYAPRAMPGLRLNGALAFTDAKYRSFPFAPCLTGQTIAEGCIIGQTSDIVRPFQNLSGQRPAQAPVWTGNVQASYDIDLSGPNRIMLATNARYNSGYRANGFANNQSSQYHQAAYATIDASVRFGAKDGSWEIGVIGKNLTNHFIISDAQATPFNGGGDGTAAAVRPDVYGAIADPRTVEVQATIKF